MAAQVLSNSIQTDAETESLDDLMLPEGRYIDLPGRGRMFYREVPNPGKPVLVLLHGMFCSALTNWHRCFHHLAPQFHIIAPDLRGHGRSMRKARSFKLRSCAKDISVLLNELDIHDAVVAGYSMGGAVLQHLIRDYPDQVSGAVLSATGYKPQLNPSRRAVAVPFMTSLVLASRLSRLLNAAPRRVVSQLVPVLNVDDGDYEQLQRALLDELRRTPMRLTMEAGREMIVHDGEEALSFYHKPSAVLATRDDGIFDLSEQEAMAELLPKCKMFYFSGNHRSCMHSLYGPALLQACLDVAKRSRATGLTS